MPREEWIRVGSELGTEREVYISEEPSGSRQSLRLVVLDEVDVRFRSVVRRYCREKSNSSSRQP